MKQQPSNFRQKLTKAFTLVETLVVVGILLVLGILIVGPGLKMLRVKSAAAACMSNLRQLGPVFHSFAAEHNGEFPVIAGKNGGTEAEKDGKDAQWDMQLLPYLEMPQNKTKMPLKKSVYFCPASEGHPSYDNKAVTLLSYAYNGELAKRETNPTAYPGIRLATAANASSVLLLVDSQNLGTSTGISYVPKVGQDSGSTIITGSTRASSLAPRHNQHMNILFIDGHVSPRRRLSNGFPEDIRWLPTGTLTGFQNP